MIHSSIRCGEWGTDSSGSTERTCRRVLGRRTHMLRDNKHAIFSPTLSFDSHLQNQSVHPRCKYRTQGPGLAGCSEFRVTGERTAEAPFHPRPPSPPRLCKANRGLLPVSVGLGACRANLGHLHITQSYTGHHCPFVLGRLHTISTCWCEHR